MAHFTGSALVVKFKGTALQADYRSFSVDESIGTVDFSSGSDTNRSYGTTLKDATASLELLSPVGGTAATAPRQLLAVGAYGTLEWNAEGTATGKPKRYALAYVTGLGESLGYDSEVTLSAEFQITGAITTTVN